MGWTEAPVDKRKPPANGDSPSLPPPRHVPTLPEFMNANRKSDGPIVPAKRANKAGTPAAESVEERGSPKGNVASHVLAPDTVPGSARHRCTRLRLVEMFAS